VRVVRSESFTATVDGIWIDRVPRVHTARALVQGPHARPMAPTYSAALTQACSYRSVVCRMRADRSAPTSTPGSFHIPSSFAQDLSLRDSLAALTDSHTEPSHHEQKAIPLPIYLCDDRRATARTFSSLHKLTPEEQFHAEQGYSRTRTLKRSR
jgi:hypothetical protein